MKRQLFIILIFTIYLTGCGIFGGSDDEPDGFSVNIDREILMENFAITVTAFNSTNREVDLLISRTGDPHIEKQVAGDWERIDEAPPAFGISPITLNPNERRSREVSYSYINQVTQNAEGEYRAYYDFVDEDGETASEYSETFTVE